MTLFVHFIVLEKNIFQPITEQMFSWNEEYYIPLDAVRVQTTQQN